MTTLIADPTLPSSLCRLTEPAEIRDPSGQLLGYFTPARPDENEVYREAARHLDPAEMQRRKAERLPGLTTRQVLEALESLGPCE